MENQEKDAAPKRRLKRRANHFLVLPILFVAILLLGAYFLFFSESASVFSPRTSISVSEESLEPGTAGQPSLQQESRPPNIPEDGDNETVEANARANQPGKTAGSALLPASDRVPSSATNSTAAPVDTVENECQMLADGVEQFFDMLDTRDYMQQFDLPEKSSVYFPRLIQKLADNPPVVSGETDDLFTILQNTAHFFRIIGKKNIIILKGILDREKATFEQALSDFYDLTRRPGCLKERFGLVIDKEAIYQYGAFFINTMGGRLYLFRRDSMSRMVVGYYSILVIDRANREGRNKYGVEISDSINRLINDIESSSIKLKMRDRYLDTLYTMKEKYQ